MGPHWPRHSTIKATAFTTIQMLARGPLAGATNRDRNRDPIESRDKRLDCGVALQTDGNDNEASWLAWAAPTG
jgi:hypothetical protein